MREYVRDQDKYRQDVAQWRDEFGRVGAPPVAPVPPQPLSVWFELQRWPGHLLVDGGLMDQPAWSWDLVDLAGRVYTHVTRQNQLVRERMGA